MGVNPGNRRKTESPGAPGKEECPLSGKNELGVDLRTVRGTSKEVDKGITMRESWSTVAQRMQWFRLDIAERLKKAALF